MGTSNAHAGKILTSDGNYSFFDNVQTLPNSNGPILKNGQMLVPYLSGLRELDAATKPLTPEEKDIVKAEWNVYVENFKFVEREFRNRESLLRKNKRELQPGWFNHQAVNSSLSIRMQALKAVIDSGNFNTLEDLVYSVYPSMKILTALTYIKHASKDPKKLWTDKEFRRDVIRDIGAITIEDLLHKIVYEGVNLNSLVDVLQIQSVHLTKFFKKLMLVLNLAI